MSKQRQPVESVATPAAVQARASQPAVVSPPEDKKPSKKKRKAEAAQTNKRDAKTTAAEPATQLGNDQLVAPTQVPLKAKKQKKTKTETAAAPALVENAIKKDEAAVVLPVPSLVPAAEDISASPAAAEKPKKKKKKDKKRGTEATVPTITAIQETPVAAAKSSKKAKAAKALLPTLPDTAAVPTICEPLPAKKKKKGSKAEPEAAAAAAAVLQSEPATQAVTGSKTKSSKKRKRDAVSTQNPAPAAAAVAKEATGSLPAVANGDSAVKPKKKKSKKAASEADALVADAPTGVIVPAVMVSPDMVILPEASVQAASADQQAGSGPGAQIQRTESGKAVAKGPTGARAFKRVNDDEWLGKKGAWDNSYEAKFGSSGWGAKASQTLLQVRGKDFRHEKTKKKRGSYKGGLIDNNVNSFKFESDDE